MDVDLASSSSQQNLLSHSTGALWRLCTCREVSAALPFCGSQPTRYFLPAARNIIATPLSATAKAAACARLRHAAILARLAWHRAGPRRLTLCCADAHAHGCAVPLYAPRLARALTICALCRVARVVFLHAVSFLLGLRALLSMRGAPHAVCPRRVVRTAANDSSSQLHGLDIRCSRARALLGRAGGLSTRVGRAQAGQQHTQGGSHAVMASVRVGLTQTGQHQRLMAHCAWLCLTSRQSEPGFQSRTALQTVVRQHEQGV